MDAITYTNARQNLAKTMEKVCQDHSPVIITRKKKRLRGHHVPGRLRVT